MTGTEPSNRICIGRFEAGLPADLEVEGRSQSIYGVSVRATPLPKGGFEAFWQQRLGAIRAGGKFQRTVDLDSGAKGAWLSDEYTGIQLEAARPFGDLAFTASRTGDEGREAVVQKLTGNVIAAYQRDGRAGFCVERGVITSEPGDAENASLLMKHKSVGDLSIKFLTQTVKDPLPEERLSDALEIEQSLPDSKVERIASSSRMVADIGGLEERFAVTPAKEPPLVRFSWKCSGESFRADLPQIFIIGIARKENQAQLAAAWDAFLNSVHKVPMASGSLR